MNICTLPRLPFLPNADPSPVAPLPTLWGRTVHCATSRLFLTAGSHGSRGPEFCTLQPLLVHLVHQGFFVLVWCLPRVPGS